MDLKAISNEVTKKEGTEEVDYKLRTRKVEKQKSKPGRKKKNGANKTYYIDVDVLGMLSEEAGEIGVSESVFIEMLVKKYVKEKQ
ncbi:MULTISPECIES: hypothetical protein [Bacillus cereus group]|uniref:hypothetical protein n=1 Tax=Bacillus cereus group TaxID=86661 RepID=UPI0018A72C10|nr:MULTISPECIES: hypothetical protein [Bacillus cereus group]MBF8118162.1 hypothetical protein [Bacillus cereus]